MPTTDQTTGLPVIIQGGMGVGISDWRLARAVASRGHLGVVSGTGIDTVMVRRLQVGDPGGHTRRALDHFPFPDIAEKILDRYFREDGLPDAKRFRTKPMPRVNPSRRFHELVVAGNFVEVWLAREGHDGTVGINYLEKIQVPTLASLYGAMLGGVDYILMGAGIPRAIPGALDNLAAGKPVSLRLDVRGATGPVETEFDPEAFAGDVPLPQVERPGFLAIVASHVLATMLARKVDSTIEGFVIEGPSAGGHNAPPRGRMQIDENGEPIYGARDIPDLEAIRALGLPFWLAGEYAEPERVAEARALGAAGVQVGTAFAYCEESGMAPRLKAEVLRRAAAGDVDIRTDPVASPTGFPFKVVQAADTLADGPVYEKRERICDLGYLRTAYTEDDGSVGWRCPAEPVDYYVRKGGSAEDTAGRMCLCNALMSTIDLGQRRADGSEEPPVITSGDDVRKVGRFLANGRDSYTAADVLAYLLPA